MVAVTMRQSLLRPTQLHTLRAPALQPAARQPVPLRNRLIVRAEQEKETISVSTGEGLEPEERPRQKSSWELIEEPVRGKAPDGGKPVSQRNNQFDELLINYDGADERAITGNPVSFPDAFRFKGAAPEVINCRLAMLGAFAGLTAELASGKSIIEQYRIAPLPIAGVFLLFAVASLIPIAKGVPRQGAKEFGSPLTFLTSDLEVNVGRVAMLGIAGTILTEAIIGHAVL
jgi:hypothetical protein